MDPVKISKKLPFAFFPDSFSLPNLPCTNIFVNPEKNKLFLLTGENLPIKNRSKKSVVYFQNELPSARFYLFFSNENWAPEDTVLKPLPGKHRKALEALLLAQLRTKKVSFERPAKYNFKRSNTGRYVFKNRPHTTKWAVPNFVLAIFYLFFPTFLPSGDVIFHDNWDCILDLSFLHWAFPDCVLFNPPYLLFATKETFLTLELFVTHCLINFNHSRKGFAAILPVYKSFKIKLNRNTFYAKNTSTLPNWFSKLFHHPNIALVLLEKPIRFMHIRKTTTNFQRKFRGTAPFRTVLVFFGFKNAHLVARNTPTSFINPLAWIQKLLPQQGNFQPRTYLPKNLTNKHCSWIVHAHDICEKILPQDLSLMPARSKQGFFEETALKIWDWSPYLTAHDVHGDFIQTWNSKILNNPKIHPDLQPLYQIRKTWGKIPCLRVTYQEKLAIVAELKLENQQTEKNSANFFCDYCASTGHKREFCDWLPNERADWCQIHKDLFRFCREYKMMNIPAFGPNPSLRDLQKFMTSIYTAEKNFWIAFEANYGHKQKEVPFPTLCWGNLSRRIGALQQLGASPRFLADLLTGADLQYKMGPDGEPLIPPRVFVEPKKLGVAENLEFLKELEKGNKMHYLVPVPPGFWYSCENVFFKESSGKLRFIQALEILNTVVRTPKFKLRDAVEIICLLHPLAFVITLDIKNAYRAIPIHVFAAAKQVFCYLDENGNKNYFLPRGMTFGLASNCAYCEAFFKNIICRVLCTLSPSLYSSNFLDDFICQVAIFSGSIDFSTLLPKELLVELTVAVDLDFQHFTFVLFYETSTFPILFNRTTKTYISERPVELFEKFYTQPISGKILKKLQFLESSLITAYTEGVRNFVFEFTGYFVPLNNKAQLKPTRTYSYLGFLADLENLSLTPKVERIEKLVNILTPCFENDMITIEAIQSVSGMLSSMNINTTVFANLKYIISRYLSSLLRYLGPNRDDFTAAEKRQPRPCPENLTAAFLEFLHHTDNFEFQPLAVESRKISFHTTHPNQHYWPKADARKVINNIVDTSDYQVGCYTEYDGKLSYLETSHLPPELMGDDSQRSAFSASSTTRELYGILISLRRNLDYINSLDTDGLRIVCDNKSALWMIFTHKAKKPINQNLVNKIHSLLTENISCPIELHWMRRSKYAVQASDHASKVVCHFSPQTTDFFKSEVLAQFGVDDALFLLKIPKALQELRSPHQPLGDFFPKTSRVFVMTAPLNVAKAETLVDLVCLRKKSCILVLPKIFGARYMDTLRKHNKFFFSRYRNLFAGIPYLGFDALVVFFQF